ncbi:MAG: hypothetical protein FWH55_13540 [Oscillospiraceae bacterium]|nr:hypothetical protein [Oscillospiraceae bacterium]
MLGAIKTDSTKNKDISTGGGPYVGRDLYNSIDFGQLNILLQLPLIWNYIGRSFDLPTEPARYEGDLVEQLRHGQGLAEYTNDSVYVGSWMYNKREGMGILTIPNFMRLTGQWFDDKPNGEVCLEMLVAEAPNVKAYIQFRNGEFLTDKKIVLSQDNVRYALDFSVIGDVFKMSGKIKTTQCTWIYKQQKGGMVAFFKAVDIIGLTYTTFSGVLRFDGLAIWFFDSTLDVRDRGSRYITKGIHSATLQLEVLGEMFIKDRRFVYKATGNFHNGDLNGFGREEYKNDYAYEGWFTDDRRNGYGTLTFHKRKREKFPMSITGFWKDGKVNGHGTLKFTDGTYYTGQLKELRPHGRGGHYTAAKVPIYKGEWVNGYPQSRGTSYRQGKIRYIGEHKRSEPHGYGKTYNDDGVEIQSGRYKNGKYVGEMPKEAFDYRGEMLNGLRNGHGTILMEDGTLYEGEFINGEKTGNFVSNGLDGDFFEGTWIEGKDDPSYTRNIWPSGLEVVGEMDENDKPHGIAKVIYPDGSTEEGEFEHSELIDGTKVHVIEPCEYEYYGEMKNGDFNGFGQLKFLNGSNPYIIEGTFENDKPQGVCTYTFIQGDVFVGTISEDQAEGKLTRSDGVVVEGVMKETENGFDFVSISDTTLPFLKTLVPESSLSLQDGLIPS